MLASTWFLSLALMVGGAAQGMFTLGSDTFGIHNCFKPVPLSGISREEWVKYFKTHQPSGVVLVDAIMRLNSTGTDKVVNKLEALYGERPVVKPLPTPGCTYMCKRE